MRHRKSVVKLGRTAAHRKAMLRNMVTDLLRHERITTTAPKARAVRSLAERMITLGKRETLHARRHAARVIRDGDVVRKLFDDVAPRYAERPGGYTRTYKLGSRSGDAAEMAIIELVEAEMKPSKKKRKKRGGSRPAAAAAAPAPEAEPTADDSAAADDEADEAAGADDNSDAEDGKGGEE